MMFSSIALSGDGNHRTGFYGFLESLLGRIRRGLDELDGGAVPDASLGGARLPRSEP